MTSLGLSCACRFSDERIPDEGAITVQFDSSIIQDAVTEKAQDTQEVGITLDPYEYRVRWMGEDEATARASEIGVGTVNVKSELGSHEGGIGYSASSWILSSPRTSTTL